MRRHLVVFATALALPILVFVATLTMRFAETERGRLEEEALNTARAVALAVDRELTGLASTVNLLALSPQLRADDLPSFHSHVIDIREKMGVGAVLRDRSGQQLLNAWQSQGAVPPAQSPLPAPQTGDDLMVVTNLFQGVARPVPMFAVEVPVETVQGQRFLSLSIPAARISQVLVDRQAPDGWTLAVVDREGTILARNVGAGTFVGTPATADLRANATGEDGSWQGFTADGNPVFASYARSTLSGWRIAVGVPEALLKAPLRRSLILLGGVGAALVGLSLLLGLLLGRSIANPLRALADQAASLGRGEPVRASSSHIAEVSAIDAALAEASGTILARQEDLRRLNEGLELRVSERTRDLAETNARLRAEAAGRERAEAQLRQSQKMEAVGRLTGGVAHDFNNLLTVVIGNLSMARQRIDAMQDDHGNAMQPPAIAASRQRVRRSIDNALEGANRAAALTQRLMVFSRQQPLAPVTLDANRLIAGMSDLLRRTLGEQIVIETRLAEGLWLAHADPNQLEASLLNLAVNARDAMQSGGTLCIETANVPAEDVPSPENEAVTPGAAIAIRVSDTGSGMSVDVQARAFEPFFTTKPVGSGTGLGLSQVYGFARQSGGHATIRSSPGQGSTVTLFLPRQPASAPCTPAAAPEPATTSRPAATVVLVVEDEAMVRDFAVSLLEEAGCRPLAAADGPAALALLERHPEVTLLFTDLVLTGPMNGRELAAAALSLRPRLPVLFTTGYSPGKPRDESGRDQAANFIGKPYDSAALLERIARLLAPG